MYPIMSRLVACPKYVTRPARRWRDTASPYGPLVVRLNDLVVLPFVLALVTPITPIHVNAGIEAIKGRERAQHNRAHDANTAAGGVSDGSDIAE